MIIFKVIPYLLCLFQQTHLLNPSLIELGLRFYIATASWLNQLALAGDSFDEMTSFKEVEIPLPSEVYKFIVFCNLMCSRFKSIPSPGKIFWFNSFNPSGSISFELFFKKVLFFEMPLSLGVSSDHPWGGYKYV